MSKTSEQSTDQAALAKIVRTSQNDPKRLEALEALTDQTLLADIASSNVMYTKKLADKVWGKLTDEVAFAYIAKNAKCLSIRQAAKEKLNKILLGKVAALDDPVVLEEIARNSVNANARHTAKKKLDEIRQAPLADIIDPTTFQALFGATTDTENSVELKSTESSTDLKSTADFTMNNGNSGDFWSDFVAFRKMLTPIWIKFLFWIGILACVICGLNFLSEGDMGPGLCIILLGPIGVRFMCEGIIVIFMILEVLTDIKNILKSNQPPSHVTACLEHFK